MKSDYLAKVTGCSPDSMISFCRKQVEKQMELIPVNNENAFLVVKSDGNFLKIGLDDENGRDILQGVNKDDGVHIGWREFESKSEMDTFLTQQRIEYELVYDAASGVNALPAPG